MERPGAREVLKCHNDLVRLAPSLAARSVNKTRILSGVGIPAAWVMPIK